METRLRFMAVGISLLVGAGLMAVKFWAYAVTGSSAILSDALESIINVVAAGFAMISVIVASRPPDKDHPYGHGKIEYFSAGFEGSLIVLAALGILHEAWDKIFHPTPIPGLDMGLALVAGAAAVNLALGLGLLWAGRRTNSLTLTADGKHVVTDVYTSVGVVVGLVLVRLTGWVWLDGLTACLVAVNILFMGVSIAKQAFSGLMDSSDPALIGRIEEMLSRHRRDIWVNVHRLRARQSGTTVHIDFHLTMPRDKSFWEVHEEVERVTELLRQGFGGMADVIIHADPCDGEDCPKCDVEPCVIRDPEAPVRSGRDRAEEGEAL